MELRLVTVAFDPEKGRFPKDPLADLGADVQSVVEHFFHHNGLPYLLLVVHVQPSSTREDRRSQYRKQWHALSAVERERFERLRAWRKSRADAAAVAPFVILSNKQLFELARRPPRTLTALRAVKGIGDKKMESFGRDLLAVITGSDPENGG